ncbi:hypothetical protein ACRARS_001739 [Yersinia enterocolitica]
MFDDVFATAACQLGRFSDTVSDPFGQSIITDVFEPMLQDISALQQLNALYQTQTLEIAKVTSELQSIGIRRNE